MLHNAHSSALPVAVAGSDAPALHLAPASGRGKRRGAAVKEEAPGGNMPVRSALVVDDEELVAMAIADYFRDLGLEVLEAFHPAEALVLLERHPGIEALVTDVRMPGMNGPELVRQARQAHPDLAVLFITGFAAEAELASAGIWPVLHKPFDLDALGPALRRAVALK